MKGFLLGAIWRTMGEHLVPRGYWHLSALMDWHKRQHIITLIISPGIVSVGASIFFYSIKCSGCIKYEGVHQTAVRLSGIFLSLAYISLERLLRSPHPLHVATIIAPMTVCTPPSMCVFLCT